VAFLRPQDAGQSAPQVIAFSSGAAAEHL
jgi:hypothetical protein